MSIKTVEMIETMKGSPDGFTVNKYRKGEVYDIPADLADVFVKQLKCAKLTKREKAQKPAENETGAAENETKTKDNETSTDGDAKTGPQETSGKQTKLETPESPAGK